MRVVGLALCLVLTACADLRTDQGQTTSSLTETGVTVLSSTTSTTAAEAALGCAGDAEDFVDDGPLGIVGGASADAQVISGLRLATTGVCERLEVELSTAGGAPATALPIVEVELIAASGVVRVTFEGTVTGSAITDSILEGSLIERAYVVRTLDGRIFVDAHLSAAVTARTFVQTNPARVAVEVQPIEAETAAFPMRAGLVVVTGPTAGSIEYPVTVTGYARTFEGTVLARLFSDTGTETEVFTTAADHVDLWGEFSLVIEEGPGGDVTIFVGEESPEDGSLTGIEFQVSAG